MSRFPETRDPGSVTVMLVPEPVSVLALMLTNDGLVRSAWQLIWPAPVKFAVACFIGDSTNVSETEKMPAPENIAFALRMTGNRTGFDAVMP